MENEMDFMLEWNFEFLNEFVDQFEFELANEVSEIPMHPHGKSLSATSLPSHSTQKAKKAVKAPRKPVRGKQKAISSSVLLVKSAPPDNSTAFASKDGGSGGSSTSNGESARSVDEKASSDNFNTVARARALISLLRQIVDATNSGDEELLTELVNMTFDDNCSFVTESVVERGKGFILAQYIQSMHTHPDGVRRYNNIRFRNRSILVDLSYTGTKQMETHSLDLYSVKGFTGEAKDRAEEILSAGSKYSYEGHCVLTFTPNASLTKIESVHVSPWHKVEVVSGTT